MQQFTGIVSGVMPIGDESTVPRHRHLGGSYQCFLEKLFQRIHQSLEVHCIRVRVDTIIDATIIRVLDMPKRQSKSCYLQVKPCSRGIMKRGLRIFVTGSSANLCLMHRERVSEREDKPITADLVCLGGSFCFSHFDPKGPPWNVGSSEQPRERVPEAVLYAVALCDDVYVDRGFIHYHR